MSFLRPVRRGGRQESIIGFIIQIISLIGFIRLINFLTLNLLNLPTNIDALLITQKENIGYLTNFWGSFGMVLIQKKQTILFTDSRYLLEAEKIIFPQIKIEDIQNIKKYLNKKEKIGYEGESITVSQLKNLQKKYPKISFRLTRKIIENLRFQKNLSEIQKIQKAAQISDLILEKIKPKIKLGITEKELSWQIQAIAFQLGADQMSFSSIVSFGINSAKAHHSPDDTKLKQGDLILIDLGVKFEKYCSDITRVFFTKEPSAKQKKVFQVVFEAQKEAIKKIEETQECAQIDSAARKYIQKNGFGEYFGHSLGHGVGIQIHESPSLSSQSEENITENNVFSIEPGIYLPNEFGIRLEDLFLYQKNSLIQLSHFTKDLNALILKI